MSNAPKLSAQESVDECVRLQSLGLTTFMRGEAPGGKAETVLFLLGNKNHPFTDEELVAIDNAGDLEGGLVRKRIAPDRMSVLIQVPLGHGDTMATRILQVINKRFANA